MSQSIKVQDTIHSALTSHFPPTAHSCTSSEISYDTDDRDLGGQAELRISLRRARQLSQLKIYGLMPSLSSGSRIYAAQQKGSLREKRKKNLKHLSNLAIRCQEACARPVRCSPAFVGAKHLRSSDEICRVFSSCLPSSMARGRLQSGEIKACKEVRRRR